MITYFFYTQNVLIFFYHKKLKCSPSSIIKKFYEVDHPELCKNDHTKAYIEQKIWRKEKTKKGYNQGSLHFYEKIHSRGSKPLNTVYFVFIIMHILHEQSKLPVEKIFITKELKWSSSNLIIRFYRVTPPPNYEKNDHARLESSKKSKKEINIAHENRITNWMILYEFFWAVITITKRTNESIKEILATSYS